ncbi:hypothetical protein H0A36_25785 [Endozoicomonas sp. SM1973]|uniref:Uncharacterized protein n=1 Tax=Spartinivicinus marinus TaxID=2994442 RepID=A0A853IHB9_9GAMM|nr:hypothetical protein [Spartinivicinus marinus]MCX4030277.1 hypothetical protein [Spartinivicinus marinus]MCX4030420.1 hypothetical protein [Spartinivicinus marinus]NYZ69431.1 hypothetical protein [Spartinivicinus marinus]
MTEAEYNTVRNLKVSRPIPSDLIPEVLRYACTCKSIVGKAIIKRIADEIERNNQLVPT